MTGLKKYRMDIDGLRAVAVLAVVFYHAGFGLFSGGYVGVDIFFVISGYLITKIISSEIASKSFTISGFYERRIKRIFPALAAVIVFTSIGSALFLFPIDFKEYGESLAAASLFLSNVYFFAKTDYFAQQADLRPLLHTWSLAVEEQYYIFFPIILILVYKFARKFTPYVIGLLFAASLAVAIYQVQTNTLAAFYLIWSRTWELLVGSMVALGVFPKLKSAAARNAASLLGLAGILVPVFFYSVSTRFPGENALPPVLGAGLLIWAGEEGETWAGRALSWRPIVFVGLISYSLYLWHWPVLVFFKHIAMREPEPWEGVLLVAAAFGLAYLSWRFVEQPVRRMKVTSKASLFGVALAGLLLVFGFGFSLRVMNGAPWRFKPEVERIVDASLDFYPRHKACGDLTPERINHDQVCTLGAPNVQPNFVVLGDSFAEAFAPGVEAIAAEHGLSGYLIQHGGCMPLQGVRQCGPFTDAALAFITRHNIRKIILIGRWASAAEASRFGSGRVAKLYLTDAASKGESLAENRRVFRDGLARTLTALGGRQVFLVSDIPEQGFNVPRIMAMSKLLHLPPRAYGVSRAAFDARQANARKIISDVAVRHPFTLIDVGQVFCSASICPADKAGVPIYVDDNHVTATEARALRGLFAPAFGP